MKIKTISRNPDDYERRTKGDLHQMQVNLDPKLHPLEAAREYKRALNAVKLERVFAKPFIKSLDGHSDGIFSLAKHPLRLSTLLSGACDGEVRMWDLTTSACLYTQVHHKGFVRGACFTPQGENFITVGDDKTIRIAPTDQPADEPAVPSTILSKSFFTAVDHHRTQDLFATSGSVVELWSTHRSEPLQSHAWGADSSSCVRFNPVEVNILASAANDRNITLYDVRGATPIRRVVLAMQTNAICWNPMEAFNFTVANEDSNLYTFDMRRLDRALNVHKDHVSAVMDIDYCPTGRQFVSGGYDKMVRIFDITGGHSKEVYHTKRMQKLFVVRWSSDAKYIITGSDETNIRLWKAEASAQIGTKAPREAAAMNYAERLKQRFKYHPEIRRISKHRHVPKIIHKQQEERRAIALSKTRKLENKRKHSKPGAVPYTAERQRHVVGEVE
eukprot:m.62636 g.62636  ORF g.62636 m.62636 type:complete len:444 (-) comp7147_c0_seq2:261-1592(-)